jgi:hypothetical protein
LVLGLAYGCGELGFGFVFQFGVSTLGVKHWNWGGVGCKTSLKSRAWESKCQRSFGVKTKKPKCQTSMRIDIQELKCQW